MQQVKTGCDKLTKGKGKGIRKDIESDLFTGDTLVLISPMKNIPDHDAEYKRYQCYMDKCHNAGLKPTSGDLKTILKKYSDEQIDYSINEASENGVCEMKYVQAILNRLNSP